MITSKETSGGAASRASRQAAVTSEWPLAGITMERETWLSPSLEGGISGSKKNCRQVLAETESVVSEHPDSMVQDLESV